MAGSTRSPRSVGTGGTLAGVSMALKAQRPGVRIVLADPEGSGMYGWVKSGDLTASGSSITEGIGQSRVTANLEGVTIDDAVRITDNRGADAGVRPPAPRRAVGGGLGRA